MLLSVLLSAVLLGGAVPGVGAQSSAGSGGGPVWAVALGSSQADVGAAALLVAAGEADAVVVAESPDSLGAAAWALVREHGARRFVLVGGPAAVGAQVEQALSGLAPDASSVRVWGEDREGTAAAVTRLVLGGKSGGAVVAVVNGWSPADVAAAAAAVASGAVDAVLYVSADGVGAAALAVLGEFDIARVLAVGGPAAIGDGVLAAAAGVAGAEATRVGGATRVETAVLIARLAASSGKATAVVTADGWEPAEATLAATVAAAIGGGAVVLYVDADGTLGEDAHELLGGAKVTRVVIVSIAAPPSRALAQRIAEAAPKATVTVVDSEPAATAAVLGEPEDSGSSGGGSSGGGGSSSGGGGGFTPPPPCGAPAVPSGVSASGSAELGKMTVRWDAPGGGRCAPSSHVVQHRPLGAPEWIDVPAAGGAASVTVSGLAAGNHQARVAASSAAGDSQPSGVVSATVHATCPAPSLTVNPTAAFGFSAAWSTQVASCRAAGWELAWRTQGASTWTTHGYPAAASAGTRRGLAPGNWEAQVRSKPAGGGAAIASQTRTVTVAGTAPSAPTGASATPSGDGEITVEWSAPAASSTNPVGGYDVSWQRQGSSSTQTHPIVDPAATRHVVTGLATGGMGWNFTVTARNPAGVSAAAMAGPVVACDVPGVPTGVSATSPGDLELTLAWTAPAGTTCALGDYRIEYKKRTGSAWAAVTASSTATSHTVGSLEEVLYDVRIRAVNTAGLVSAWAATTVTPTPTAFRAWWGDSTPRSIESGSFSGAKRLFLRAESNPHAAMNCQVTWTSDASKTRTINCARGALVSVSNKGLTFSQASPSAPEVPLCGTELRVTGTASIGGVFAGSLPERIGTLCGPILESDEVRVSAGNAKLGVAWTVRPDKWGDHPASDVGAGGIVATATTAATVVNGAEIQYKATTDTSWTALTPRFGEGEGVWYAQLDSATDGVAYDIRIRMSNDARDTDDNTNWWGFRIHLTSPAVTGSGTAPGAPTSSGHTPAFGRVTVDLTAPASNGGADIAYYEARHKLTGADDSTYATTRALGGSTSIHIGGLEWPSTYTVQIRAVNANGASGWTTVGTALVPAEPFRVWWDGNIRPDGDVQTAPGQAQPGLSHWDPKSAAVFSVVLSGNQTAFTGSCAARSGTVVVAVACPPGVRVRAGGESVSWTLAASGFTTGPGCGVVISLTGTGTFTAADGVAHTATTDTRSGTVCGPYIPANALTRISVGNRRIGVAWSSAGRTESGGLVGKGLPGAVVNSAELEYRAVGATSWTSATIDIDGGDNGVWYADTAADLTAGTAYEIRIRLRNNAADANANTNWWGFWHHRTTAAVSSTGAAPGSPGSLSGTAGNAQIAVSWAAPASDGGAAVAYYQIRHRVASPQGAWTTATVLGSATSHTVSGLTNSTGYNVQIRAANANGESAWTAIGTTHTPTS